MGKERDREVKNFILSGRKKFPSTLLGSSSWFKD